jgi:hypothetical protein
MSAPRRFVPIILIVIALVGAGRFLPNVRSVDAVGLFACGALAGISVMRLLASRRPRQPRRSNG